MNRNLKLVINIPPSKGTIGIFFSSTQTTSKAIKVAIMNGVIASFKSLLLLRYIAKKIKIAKTKLAKGPAKTIKDL